MISHDERNRYQRQLPLIAEDGQEKLRNARILIAGVGGLGTIIATYLAAAGVGRIRLVDHDKVETSNFNRQMLHFSYDLGKQKIMSASEKLMMLNPYVKIESIDKTINEHTVHEKCRNMDIIIDAMDNFPTRYLLNRAAIAYRIPLFHGAVRGFYGQATTIMPCRTACLKCIFPTSPPPETFPIIGATCGVIGSIQSTEVIKYLTNKGDLLNNRMLFWDGLSGNMNIFAISKNPYCQVCGNIILPQNWTGV
jgi:adenylyltransferase/sulfurtransferase